MSLKTIFRIVGLVALAVLPVLLVPGRGAEVKGKKYALLVGVTEYKGDKFGTLRYTENDVEELKKILDEAGFTKVRILTNKRGEKDKADAPTAANVKKAIDELVEDKGKRDTVLVAFSGHGANVKVEDPDEKGKPKTYSYFCPYDASLLGPSYSTGKSKFLVNLHADLFDKLEHCGARSKLVLIDACRNEFKAEAATRSLGIDKETIPGGLSVLFSCSKDEVAWESDKLKHGVFFHFVLLGLRGKAKNDDGEVTWKRLTAYVVEQVERQVGTIVGNGASQTPHELGNVAGTPVLVPAGKSPKTEEITKDKDAEDEAAVPAREDKGKPDRKLAEQIDADRKTSMRNLQRIALAVHAYADSDVKGFLPDDVKDKKGKALLSWRVAILPHLEQKALYEKFKLAEAWDGPNNKKLLAQMPDLFRSPRVKLKGKGHTVYQVFTGADAVFGRANPLAFPAGIPDGTSNTLMAVESTTATAWTKPGGIPFVRGKKVPDFGKAYGNKPLAAMMDGSVRSLDLKKISAATLQDAIDPADGNALGKDWND